MPSSFVSARPRVRRYATVPEKDRERGGFCCRLPGLAKPLGAQAVEAEAIPACANALYAAGATGSQLGGAGDSSEGLRVISELPGDVVVVGIQGDEHSGIHPATCHELQKILISVSSKRPMRPRQPSSRIACSFRVPWR